MKTIWRLMVLILIAISPLSVSSAVCNDKLVANPAFHHGLRIVNGRVVEANGTDLVMRGANYGFVWNPDKTQTFADVKATGANSIRVLFGIGVRWPANTVDDVKKVVALCKKNKLICVLSPHDTSGYHQFSQAASQAQAVAWWNTVKSAVIGQEDYVVVNVANEPFGSFSSDLWKSETTTAVLAMRKAGFTNTLMVDGDAWGQDDNRVMPAQAAEVLKADPLHNLVFSAHMYGIYNTEAKVKSYLSLFASKHLPFVVGEFANAHTYGKPDANAIMKYAQLYKFGYFGWSWSGNEPLTSYLDMVSNYESTQLTSWGQRFLHGPNGVAVGSKEAEVFTQQFGILVSCVRH